MFGQLYIPLFLFCFLGHFQRCFPRGFSFLFFPLAIDFTKGALCVDRHGECSLPVLSFSFLLYLSFFLSLRVG